jgi:membrane-associated phospholipid phosphatase
MLDNMALQDADENPITPTTAPVKTTVKTFRTQFARSVSTVFSPVTVSLPAILLVALYHQEPSSLFFAAIAVLFLSIGPMLYIVVGVSLGKFSDIDVSIRSQRLGPFIFGITSSLIGFFILQYNNAPKNIETVLLAASTIGFILMIITFWWKISMHASALSGTITFLAILYGKFALPAFLLVFLVGWSRVVLKRHTAAQVTMGAVLTAILTLGVLALRGIS